MELPRFSVVAWLFGPGPREGPGHLWPRWIFLRALGLIFFSAFYSLLFQIRGLIGPEGILPAGPYLQEVAQALGPRACWYAPYQPRFDWNMWFASLVPWRQSLIVIRTEAALLVNSHDVLTLFNGNPFADSPPRFVRAVMWQYWFTDLATKRKTGLWWNRKLLGLFAPMVALRPDGRVGVVEWPSENLPPPESPYEP